MKNSKTQKVSFEEQKVSFEEQKVSLIVLLEEQKFYQPTIEKTKDIYSFVGPDGVFGRMDVVAITNLSVPAAGKLIDKLKQAGLIESVTGYGKGKYRFVNSNNFKV